jgi:hypothetical protein
MLVFMLRDQFGGLMAGSLDPTTHLGCENRQRQGVNFEHIAVNARILNLSQRLFPRADGGELQPAEFISERLRQQGAVGFAIVGRSNE